VAGFILNVSEGFILNVSEGLALRKMSSKLDHYRDAENKKIQDCG